MKKIFWIALIGLVVLVSLGGSLWWIKNLMNKVFVSPINPVLASGQNNSGPSKFLNSVSDYFKNEKPLNILLLGYGGGNHEGTYLTDSMMVANVDFKLKKITLISIPRDTWVKMPDGNYKKINAAYSDGIVAGGAAEGGKLAEQMVGQVTGLKINYFVSVDFSGFKKTIDTLGGVDVRVDVTFDDYQYPIEGQESNLCGHAPEELPQIEASASATTQPQDIFPCRYEHVHFDTGLVHMDGESALKYVRSRHSAQDGNDFGRAKRQKNLLMAVKQKIMTVNFLPAAIPFINSLGNDVKTSLTPEDMKTFIQNTVELNQYQIGYLALTDENYLQDSYSSDGQYILIPKMGQDNWTEIQSWISQSLSNKPVPIPAVVQIENGTSISGLGAKALSKVKSAGIKTVAARNSTLTGVSTTTVQILDANVQESDVGILKNIFGVQNVQMGESKGENYNVLVTVGSDFNSRLYNQVSGKN